jgi:hypothetical protein
MSLPGVPPWTNPDIELFHGTLDVHVPSLLSFIRVSRGRAGAEFGRGFYATTSFLQAEDWAKKLVLRARMGGRSVNPAVIRLQIDRRSLSTLHQLCFVRSNKKDSLDFWSLVQTCRTTGGPHYRLNKLATWYDLIVAPVTQRWLLQQMKPDSDQYSFHTAAGENLLNSFSKSRVL